MAINSSPAQSPGTIDTPPSDGGSWSFLDPVGGTTSYAPSSVGLLHSPASQHSLASFGIVVHKNPRPSSQNPSLSSLGLRSSHESMSLPMAPTSSPVGIIPAGSQQPQTPSTFAELARQHAQQQAHQLASSFPHPLPGSMGSAASGSVTGTVGGSLSNSMGGSLGGSGDFNALLADPEMFLADKRLQELVPRALQSQQALQTPQTQQAQQSQQAQEAQQLASIFPDLLQPSASHSQWATMSLSDIQQDDHIFNMDGYSQTRLSSPNHSFVSTSPVVGHAPSPIVGSFSDEETNLALNAFVLQEQEQQFQRFQFQQSQLGQLQHLSMNMEPSQHEQEQQLSIQQLQQYLQFQQLQAEQLLQQPRNNASPPSSRSMQAPLPVPKSKASLTRQSPYNLNKVRGSGIRVTKKKAQASPSATDKGQLSTSAGSEDRFVVFTPKSINSQSGSGNRFAFEGVETTSATQKGRKGPLTEDAKLSALNVRRSGACVCCHSRKVACGNELPCKNCLKLLRPGVPIDLVCWRFENFTGPLFPDFLRDHFQADAMFAFVSENVASFSINGIEQPCTVRLSLGPAFLSYLEIRGAKIFTPTPTSEVLNHTTLSADNEGMHLSLIQTAPIGLDPEVAAAAGQQEKIRKACRSFTDNIVKEETYVQQLTYNPHTDLPGKILGLVRRFFLRTNAPIVKTALSIYSMNFMMTHHLGLTYETLQHLAPLGVVPPNAPYVTARLLNRQVKAILDQFMKDEMDKLFKLFLNELKAKSRTTWATCVAAFLVFCLFMEETGVAIDYFAVSENEADLQFSRDRKESNERVSVVKLCRELENQPFRKFSYQFHKVYQTYQDVPGVNRAPTATTTTTEPTSTPSPTSRPSSSSDSNSKPRSTTARPRSGANAKAAFNPLVDDKVLYSNDLDKHALEFVLGLRELIEPSSESREELEELTKNPMLDFVVETHPYPRDVAENYKGRLVAKFLLSFQDERYIFTPAP